VPGDKRFTATTVKGLADKFAVAPVPSPTITTSGTEVYPKPDEVIVTAVTWPKVGEPTVVSTVAVAVAPDPPPPTNVTVAAV
jgi:hypothetical protein